MKPLVTQRNHQGVVNILSRDLYNLTKSINIGAKTSETLDHIAESLGFGEHVVQNLVIL